MDLTKEAVMVVKEMSELGTLTRRLAGRECDIVPCLGEHSFQF